MPAVPGLRSNYLKTGRLVYFGRMVVKIRLQAVGQLPADYVGNLSKGFDLRCCNFLRVPYATLQARTLTGGTDEEILAWAFATGGAMTAAPCSRRASKNLALRESPSKLFLILTNLTKVAIPSPPKLG